MHMHGFCVLIRALKNNPAFKLFLLLQSGAVWRGVHPQPAAVLWPAGRCVPGRAAVLRRRPWLPPAGDRGYSHSPSDQPTGHLTAGEDAPHTNRNLCLLFKCLSSNCDVASIDLYMYISPWIVINVIGWIWNTYINCIEFVEIILTRGQKTNQIKGNRGNLHLFWVCLI